MAIARSEKLQNRMARQPEGSDLSIRSHWAAFVEFDSGQIFAAIMQARAAFAELDQFAVEME